MKTFIIVLGVFILAGITDLKSLLLVLIAVLLFLAILVGGLNLLF